MEQFRLVFVAEYQPGGARGHSAAVARLEFGGGVAEDAGSKIHAPLGADPAVEHHAQIAALDSGGTFPADLAGLRKAGSLPEDLKVTNSKTGQEGIDPIYFPGLNNSSGGALILVACPFTNHDGTRSVAQVDGSVTKIPEDEYQARVAKQK